MSIGIEYIMFHKFLISTIICVYVACVSYALASVYYCLVVTWLEKGLTYWLLLVMLVVFFVTFPCGILGQVWYLIVSFPDVCRLSYFWNVVCNKFLEINRQFKH